MFIFEASTSYTGKRTQDISTEATPLLINATVASSATSAATTTKNISSNYITISNISNCSSNPNDSIIIIIIIIIINNNSNNIYSSSNINTLTNKKQQTTTSRTSLISLEGGSIFSKVSGRGLVLLPNFSNSFSHQRQRVQLAAKHCN